MQKLNQTFKINPLNETDGYKVGHKPMLAPGTTKLYGTWIPRSLKYMPGGINKIMSAGQQIVARYLHSTFQENFFNVVELEYTTGVDDTGRPYSLPTGKVINKGIEPALKFSRDMSAYLGMEYDGKHFEELWKLGYLPIKIKSLPEGIFTEPNIPHMTFINTVDGYAWLTLFLETFISKLAWQTSTAATIAAKFKENAVEWVKKTDEEKLWLTDYMCHDFHARGGNPFTSIAVGLGHAMSHRGSDTLNVIPASRYYYDEAEDSMPINSVNASEHSVSTTKIFTVGEQQMITDWLKIFPKGILSLVSDTFDLWKLITEYLPANKEAIMARDGKLVIRPDSGNPVDIICGHLKGNEEKSYQEYKDTIYKMREEKGIVLSMNKLAPEKGVVELLWDVFGGTINAQGYKVLDPHIGAIYGDSINLERQVEIYTRLAAKGFAATNVVLGVGSFTYVMLTRDSAGFAAKGSWFEVKEHFEKSEDTEEFDFIKSYNIYKDPITDDGSKRSLRGLLSVHNYEIMEEERDGTGTPIKTYKGLTRPLKGERLQIFLSNPENIPYYVKQECTWGEESKGLLQTIYEDGSFYNQTTLSEIRERVNKK